MVKFLSVAPSLDWKRKHRTRKRIIVRVTAGKYLRRLLIREKFLIKYYSMRVNSLRGQRICGQTLAKVWDLDGFSGKDRPSLQTGCLVEHNLRKDGNCGMSKVMLWPDRRPNPTVRLTGDRQRAGGVYWINSLRRYDRP